MTLKVTLNAQAPIPLNLSFEVGPGELLALVGPSGSGKTTTLRTIAGFWRPEMARVEVGGVSWLDTEQATCLAPHRRRVGLVFQDFALFPHMTAAGNVAAAMVDLPAQDRAFQAERLLRLVHLDNLGHRRPAELSGGQKQRVALARALGRRPDVLLLDEPFSAVDRATRERLHEELIGLRTQLPMPIILVTHDIGEAQVLSDRMAVIDRGKLVTTGTTASVMSDPVALRHLGVREVAAILSARLVSQETDGTTQLETAGGPIWLPRLKGATGQRFRIRVLAHQVILSQERPQMLSVQNVLSGRVVSVSEGIGPGVLVRVAIGDDEIVARITRRAATSMTLAPGQSIFALIEAMSVARGHFVLEMDGIERATR